jgi:hypothetical protein
MIKTRRKALIDSFKDDPKRTSLAISNLTSDEDLGQLLSEQTLQKLEILILEDSFFSNKDSVKSLNDAISTHPNLKKLVLNTCTFTNEIINEITLNAKQLKEIEFSYMLQDHVFILLTNAIKNNSSLKCLRFSCLEISAALEITINQIVENSQIIEKITINDCCIDFNSLVKSYKKSQCPIEFNLEGAINKGIIASLRKHTAYLKSRNICRNSSEFFSENNNVNVFKKRKIAVENPEVRTTSHHP